MTVLTLHANATGQFEAVDPIVSPGIRPSAHEHTFYGAKNITPDSTPLTITGGPTSAKTQGDSNGMWVPTLFCDGTPVRTTKLHCGEYWLSGGAKTVETPPVGMCFVAGNSHAMSQADMIPGAVQWHARNGPKQDAPYDCTTMNKGPLKYEVFFPNLWDGTPADPVTGKIDPSHFSYATGATPVGMHRIAQLGLQIDLLDAKGAPLYNPFDAQGNVRLTFGDGMLPWFAVHADFMNGFVQPDFEALVQGCINGIGVCPPHS